MSPETPLAPRAQLGHAATATAASAKRPPVFPLALAGGGGGGPTGRATLQVLRFLLDARDPNRVAHRAVACLGLLPEVRWAELDGPANGAPGQLTADFETEGYADLSPRRLTIQLEDPDDDVARAAIEELVTLIVSLHSREREIQRLVDEAHTDPLTELWNRRGFLPFIDQALGRVSRTDEEIAIVSCDVDNFKQINDTLGHDAGDRALAAVAAAIRSVIRPTDAAARLGGDEFTILLAGSNALGAAKVATRLQQAVADANPVAPIPLTLSIGISDTTMLAEVGADDETHERLARAADEALYMAKAAGRARAVCHPATCVPSPDPAETAANCG